MPELKNTKKKKSQPNCAPQINAQSYESLFIPIIKQRIIIAANKLINRNPYVCILTSLAT